ncbi:coiled-coil domain-containing protein 12 [Phymastichus coffea]|uniref:coiled-coil domain-containing protein 12 n=1 Tax=Phymastichus coffea TaxID=108790 RepID=UPI00273AD448|nr:coiled-coil domain-containing protein 12 [Phymastichus coffea]XP_058808662.1 coiled-coil domain-containing protein 12 [Phymastichus coffea]XP_058808663.1 coiled-coil domain-containing protein 12 [Phymastichus coffea]XP_058808664.1 coiled-coil domain-containing protein 12 [Phymastichus coffea]
MTENEKIGTLEEEALKRKERLKALKRKANNPLNNDETTKLPPPKFRSYKPSDESLKEKALEDAKAGDIESEVKDQLQAATTKPVIEELDISNLAPRKSDWDLKRDCSKKLEKLQKRTQKAIAEIIMERAKKQDLATAVKAGSEVLSKS